ncbi:phage tail domain-containing protein [Cellulosimicrobium sp. TH-20]|uniref:phage tail domain-containing protein n=1 Tax=Cellulosimicrobium sp. TH-20 TaxID=1980001 RepID=UPI0011A2BD0F|nr:phage tail domain-containing protein [Cellulosimicrobium sp. TH-20]
MVNLSRLTLSGGGAVVDLNDHLDTLAPTGAAALDGLDGFGLPPVSPRFFEGAGDGATYRGTRVLPRDVSLPILFTADSRAELRERVSALATVLAPENAPALLTYTEPDGAAWTIEVVRTGSGSALTDHETYYGVTVALRAPDPFWTAVTAVTRPIRPGGAGRGLLRPGGSLTKLRVASGQVLGEVVVENPGDAPAYPITTLQGPATAFTLRSARGETLQWEGDLGPDERRVFDHRASTLVDENGVNRYDELQPAPRFWAVPPGVQTATVEVLGSAIGTPTPTGEPLRTNLVINPKPETAAGWRQSTGEVMRPVTDEEEPALEFLDEVGGGALYGDPNQLFTPTLGQWAACGYDLRALDADTAREMRVRIASYGGHAVQQSGSISGNRPLAAPRVNAFANPSFETGIGGVYYSQSVLTITSTTYAPAVKEGTTALSVTVGAGAGAYTYLGQAIRGAQVEGRWSAARIPVRWSSGSRYYRARIIFYNGDTQVGDAVSPWLTGTNSYAQDLVVSGQAPAGTTRALAYLYVSATGEGSGSAPAEGSAFHTDGWIAATATTQAAALADVATYFDGDTPSTPDAHRVWGGTRGASVSRELRPYERVTAAAQVTAYDPAGWVRFLVWPNTVPTPENGFRLRRAVVAFADTEAGALAAVERYFDGDTAHTSERAYAWQGTPGASPSVERAVTVQGQTSVSISWRPRRWFML